MDKDNVSLLDLARDISNNISILGISGLFGVATRAIFFSDDNMQRKIAQAVAGLVSAVFFGAILANMITPFVKDEVYAWLASGFICGFAGEVVIEWVQSKFMEKEEEKDP